MIRNMKNKPLSEKQQAASNFEILGAGLGDYSTSPVVLNALYDAAKNRRCIWNDEEVLPNGTYYYKTIGDGTQGETDYVPIPVFNNHMLALNELEKLLGEVSVQLTLFYDVEEKLWSAICVLSDRDLNNINNFYPVFYHPESNQALARAVMYVVCCHSASREWRDE